MSYTETLHELGQETQRQVLALWELVPDELSPDDFDELAAVIVATASAQGAALAELSLLVAVAGELGTAAAAPAAVAPSLHHLDTGRLTRAFRTARESSTTGDPTARLARLARAEPVESSQRAYSRAIAEHPAVTGWVRALDADPCQLCRWWWREGRIWPSSHPMPTHKGCECHPKPVVAHNIRPVSR